MLDTVATLRRPSRIWPRKGWSSGFGGAQAAVHVADLVAAQAPVQAVAEGELVVDAVARVDAQAVAGAARRGQPLVLGVAAHAGVQVVGQLLAVVGIEETTRGGRWPGTRT